MSDLCKDKDAVVSPDTSFLRTVCSPTTGDCFDLLDAHVAGAGTDKRMCEAYSGTYYAVGMAGDVQLSMPLQEIGSSVERYCQPAAENRAPVELSTQEVVPEFVSAVAGSFSRSKQLVWACRSGAEWGRVCLNAPSYGLGVVQVCNSGCQFMAASAGSSGADGCATGSRNVTYAVLCPPLLPSVYSVMPVSLSPRAATPAVAFGSLSFTGTLPEGVEAEVTPNTDERPFNGGTVSYNPSQSQSPVRFGWDDWFADPSNCGGYCVFSSTTSITGPFTPATCLVRGNACPSTPSDCYQTGSSPTTDSHLLPYTENGATLSADGSTLIATVPRAGATMDVTFRLNRTNPVKLLPSQPLGNISGWDVLTLRQNASFQDVVVLRSGGPLTVTSRACEFTFMDADKDGSRMYSVSNPLKQSQCDLVVGTGGNYRELSIVAPVKDSPVPALPPWWYDSLWADAYAVVRAEEGLSTGAIVGIVLGVVLGTALIATVIVLAVCCRKRIVQRCPSLKPLYCCCDTEPDRPLTPPVKLDSDESSTDVVETSNGGGSDEDGSAENAPQDAVRPTSPTKPANALDENPFDYYIPQQDRATNRSFVEDDDYDLDRFVEELVPKVARPPEPPEYDLGFGERTEEGRAEGDSVQPFTLPQRGNVPLDRDPVPMVLDFLPEAQRAVPPRRQDNTQIANHVIRDANGNYHRPSRLWNVPMDEDDHSAGDIIIAEYGPLPALPTRPARANNALTNANNGNPRVDAAPPPDAFDDAAFSLGPHDDLPPPPHLPLEDEAEPIGLLRRQNASRGSMTEDDDNDDDDDDDFSEYGNNGFY